MGKTFKKMRDTESRRSSKTVDRWTKNIDKHRKHIYNEASLKEDLYDDVDEAVLDHETNHIQRKYEE